MRFATDTGGTFTDLVVEHDDGRLRIYKAATVPADPVRGVLDALGQAAADHGSSLKSFLERGEVFIHGTTHAINAIITGRTARTAFVTTEGHPDVLVLREAGRIEPFNHTAPYPRPFVPRRFTYQVRERVDSAGRIFTPLDEASVVQAAEAMQHAGIEAVGVCLLWSTLNPAHELRVGEILRERLPAAAVSLSHQLNPCIREYPRAISTCLDAALKPMMSRYLGGLESRLREAGFSGRILVLTSQGGMLDASQIAEAPIHSINSGPSVAPVAGRHYASAAASLRDVIVADTGGTTYDVSLVRDGHIPFTRETWLGQAFRSDVTGFPSVDVKSVGAGGGSIAWVDDGGILHVGPDSAGAVPGPACYGRGGNLPTLTDACVALGYIDPQYFLGGTMTIDASAARRVLEPLATKLGHSLEQGAHAIVDVATENMVQAISQITINRGVDPAGACLVAGGGAAGLNCSLIARRLRCPVVLIPAIGSVLSAAGALMTELRSEYRQLLFTTSARFDHGAAQQVLRRLVGQCLEFARRYGNVERGHRIEFAVEARYPSQVWEIELPLLETDPSAVFDIGSAVARFHDLHERIYAVSDPGSEVEFVTWIARVRCAVSDARRRHAVQPTGAAPAKPRRQAWFSRSGSVAVDALGMDELRPRVRYRGPTIVETPFTTAVIQPEDEFEQSEDGSLLIYPGTLLT